MLSFLNDCASSGYISNLKTAGYEIPFCGKVKPMLLDGSLYVQIFNYNWKKRGMPLA